MGLKFFFLPICAPCNYGPRRTMSTRVKSGFIGRKTLAPLLQRDFTGIPDGPRFSYKSGKAIWENLIFARNFCPICGISKSGISFKSL